jgi:hypothetical protein
MASVARVPGVGPLIGWLAPGVSSAASSAVVQWLAFAVLAGSALLAVSLSYAAWRTASFALPEPVPPLLGEASAEALSVVPALEDALASAMARPLFAPSRRPPASVAEELAKAEAVVEKSAPAPQLDARLVGLYVSGYTEGVILQTAGERKRLLLGESHEGWTLFEVESRGAIFKNGPQLTTLPLEYAGNAPATPQSARARRANRGS